MGTAGTRRAAWALRRLAHRARIGVRRWAGPRATGSPPTLDQIELHYNEVLGTEREIDHAVAALGWEHPHHRGKTWDILKTLHYVLRAAPERESRILDAGCADSPILERLHAYGYRSLYGCDLTDRGIPRVPGLVFRKGDLTRTAFSDDAFDLVACHSVIEHGVSIEAFFAEMARVLAPSGHLLVSTDYREPKLSTVDIPRGATYDLPWTIFSRREIEALVAIADRHGFTLRQPIRWRPSESPIRWAGQQYTFIYLAFLKPSGGGASTPD
jgi:SAM-dependent methyltransferase